MGNSEYELNGQHKKLKNIEEGEEDQNENETSKQLERGQLKSNEPLALPAVRMNRSEIKKSMNKE